MSNQGFIVGANQTLTVFRNGKTYNVNTEHPNYQTVLSHVRVGNYSQLDELVNVKKAVERYVNKNAGSKNLKIEGNTISYNGTVLHGVLVNKILSFLSNRWNAKPLINFLNNLMENPSNRSVETLYPFIEQHGIVITEDGHFIAYKSVDGNYMDCYSHTISNKVGQKPKMERNQISDDPNHACHKGLHVASLAFALEFTGVHKMIVKVNPRDVVSVPHDANASKIRVCEYEVIGENTDTPKEVEQSDYASVFDESYNDDLEAQRAYSALEDEDDDDFDDEEEVSSWGSQDDWDDEDEDEDEEDDSYVTPPPVEEAPRKGWFGFFGK